MSFRILHSASGGVVRWVSSTPGNDQVVVHDEQEVGDLLRANARDADVDQTGQHFRLVARVPMSIMNKAIQEGWSRDKEKWREWLNNSDNRAFRVWPGKV
jgi:hypothetical protein